MPEDITSMRQIMEPLSEISLSRLHFSKYNFLVNSGGNQNLKTGQGILFGVLIGNPTLTSAIQAFDGTTSAGTSICKIAAAVSGGFYNIAEGVKFNTGLTVSSGSVLDNVTFAYL